MERIILELDEAMARKWNALSHERRKYLTRQFEQLVSGLFADVDNSDSMKETISEPSITYTATARKEMGKIDAAESKETPLTEEERKLRVQKARDFFNNLSADFTGYKFDRNEANER